MLKPINDHGLLLRRADEPLGDLLDVAGRGCYDPVHGRVDVSREEAETHNRIPGRMLIGDLDGRCAVGQGGDCYVRRRADGSWQVTTWAGDVVAEEVAVEGRVFAFTRKGRRFRGTKPRDADYVFFRRIS